MLTIEREIASQPEVWRRSAEPAEAQQALLPALGGAQLTAPPTLDRARRKR